MLRPLFVALLFVVPLPVAAQAPSLDAAVDRAAWAQFEKQNLVGLTVGVVDEGQVAYLKGFGYADRETCTPVDPGRTLFRWASCSKPLTALAALQLAEAGKLDLDANVRDYVPEFPDKGTPITARQLLCHQGGVVHYVNGKVVRTKRDYDAEHPFEDVVLALDTFKESPLVCKPGEKFSYTTHGYILLSAAVQKAGKQPFADQVRDRIARPLGMATLRPDYQWQAIPNRAVGYRRKTKDEVVRSTDTDVSWKLGGGGYVSTVEDFARLAAGLVNRKLVSEKTEAAMWTRQKLANGSGTTNYGLGFSFGKTPGGREWVGHSGSQEKTKTMLMLEPKARRAVVVMTNCEWANPAQVAAAVLDAVAVP
jgi:CubicO group peptidase (beta-lactamase class C family)